MLLAKRQGGTTIHGHHWEHDDAAVDVPYGLAVELLAIKGGGFYVPESESAGEAGESPKPRAKKQDAPAAAAPAPPAVKPAAGK